MKLNFKYISAVIATTLSIHAFAQQTSLFNTYVYDPMQINIAYAGHNCTEANLHYRSQWVGISDSPRLLQLNAHTSIGQSSGLALKVANQQAGLLNSLQATIGYAYRVKLSKKGNVHMGLGLGMTQNSLNTQKAIVTNSSDATLNNSSKQKSTGIDGEFGAMYVDDKLKLGVAMLHVFNSNPKFAASTYKVLPQANISASYLFNSEEKFEVEPWILDRYTLQGSNTIEGMLNLHFDRKFTLGIGYRANYGMLAFVGAKIGKIKIGYSFDYGSTKNALAFGTSHQILLGIKLCKKDEEDTDEMDYSTEVFTSLGVETPKEEVKRTGDEVAKVASTSVEFNPGSDVITDASHKSLDDLAEYLKAHPESNMKIAAHTDTQETPEAAMALSEKRANAVKTYLTSKGVNAESVKTEWFGGTVPVADNISEDGRKKNNRVVIQVVPK